MAKNRGGGHAKKRKGDSLSTTNEVGEDLEVVEVEEANDEVNDVQVNVQNDINGGGQLTTGRRSRRGGKKPVDAYGSPNGLYKLIQKLEEDQIKSIKEIGFGGLLELKAQSFYHIMLPFLMEKYDEDAHMFILDDMRRCAVTVHDVYDIFMIPGEGGKVVDAKALNTKDYPDMGLVNAFKAKFGKEKEGNVPLDSLFEEMLKLKNGGDEFKKYFVLFVMGTFLAPSSSYKADLRLIRVVENVAEIKNLDWCAYVLSKLNSSIRSHKTHNTSHVGGCMFILQLVYFHRLIWRGRKEPSDIPLVKHWTYEKLKARVEEERAGTFKPGGRYGMGEWDNTTYPVSVQAPVQPNFVDVNCSDGVECSHVFLTDEEIRQKYSNPYEAACHMTRRDLEKVVMYHERRIADLKKLENAGDVVPVEVSLGTQFSWEKEFDNPSFLAELEAYGRRIDELVDEEKGMPSFDLGVDSELMERPFAVEDHPDKNFQFTRQTRLAKKKMDSSSAAANEPLKVYETRKNKGKK